MPKGMGVRETNPNLVQTGPVLKKIGVRLFHKTLRSCTIVIIHPTRRYKVPFQCPTCNKLHERKAVHLNLDNQGSVIVSRGVFKGLQESGLPDLTVANEVGNPPPQTLYVGSTPQAFEVEEIDMGKARGRFSVLRKRLIRG